jgi:hypothetical protein
MNDFLGSNMMERNEAEPMKTVALAMACRILLLSDHMTRSSNKLHRTQEVICVERQYLSTRPTKPSSLSTIIFAMPSKQVFESKDGAVYTTSNGAPVSEPYAAQRAGTFGPLLLQGMS